MFCVLFLLRPKINEVSHGGNKFEGCLVVISFNELINFKSQCFIVVLLSHSFYDLFFNWTLLFFVTGLFNNCLWYSGAEVVEKCVKYRAELLFFHFNLLRKLAEHYSVAV